MSFVHEICSLFDQAGDFSEEILASAAFARGAGTIFLIGNGGSAAIASHLAIDWTKSVGVRALCFNDPASLTAIGNDLGYDQVFAYPIQQYGKRGDLLLAISASGRSPNILAGAGMAKHLGIPVITFSGFDEDNPLRSMGVINFYVPSHNYGLVECSHLILNHAVLNAAIGLRKS